MNFKKISISLLSLFALSTLLINTVYAQNSQGTTVATISISDARIVSQSDRNFVLSFDIKNKTGAQPDIKYGVQLFQVTSKGVSKVDETVYDEVLSLGSNTTINKKIDYVISNSIPAGEYKIYIVSKNSSGLSLGISLAGQATIGKSTSESIQILKDSCYISTSTSLNATKYPIDLGFSISPKEQLILKCKVTSTLANTTFKTNFVTKSGSAYGDIVSIDSSSTESVLIKKGTNEIVINLPKASKPQNYNLSVSLESPKAISNIISINYNLMGQTGTIQNLVFDKTYYSKGDTANLQIYSTQYGTGIVSVVVTDENNQKCSETKTQNVNSFSVIDLPVEITKDCNNPNANVVLSSGDKVLSSKGFNIISNDADKVAAFKKDMIAKIIIVVVAIVVLLTAGFIIKRKKKGIVIMLAIIAIAGFGLSAKAEICNRDTVYDKTINYYKTTLPSDWKTSHNINFYFDLGMSVSVTEVITSDDFGPIMDVYYYSDSGDVNGTWTPYSGDKIPHRYWRILVQRWEKFGSTLRFVGTYNENYTCDTKLNDLAIISFTTSSNSVPKNGSATISWKTVGATNCTLIWNNGSEGGTVTVDPNSSFTIKNMTKNATQALYCTKVEEETVKTVSEFDLLFQFGYGGLTTNYSLTEDGHFNGIDGITLDSLGNIYTIEGYNHRVQKFDSSGKFIMKFGTQGSGDGQFLFPKGIVIDEYNYIYVFDSQNNRIQKFYPSGQYYSQFGSNILNTNKTGGGIALDPSKKYLYVTDIGNNCIRKFDINGNLINTFGSYGQDPGQFKTPYDVFVNSLGYVYVVDNGNNRIQKFDSTGKYISQFGTKGSGNGQLDQPRYIAIDSLNNIYISDYYNNRIQKFDLNGVYLNQFQSYGIVTGMFTDYNNDIYVTDSFGPLLSRVVNFVSKFSGSSKTITTQKTTDNKDNPSMLDIEVYEPDPISVDISASPIKVKENENTFITWQSQGASYCNLSKNGNQWIKSTKDLTGYEYVSEFGSYGTGTGQFIAPFGISTDNSNNIYVTDVGRNDIQKFDSTGKYISQFGTKGSGNGQFNQPEGIVVDSSGNIYVVDNQNHRVQKFDKNGVYQLQFGTKGTGNGQFKYPVGIAIDSSDNIYVADHGNTRIQKFNSNGNYLSQFSSIVNNEYGGSPDWLSIDSSNNIFVTDTLDHVKKFNSSGTSIFDAYVNVDNSYNNSPRISLDSFGYLYLSGDLNIVQKFSSTSTINSSEPIYQFGSYGTDDGQFKQIGGMNIDSNNNIYIVDKGNYRVQKFGYKTENTSGSKPTTIATTTEFTINCVNKNNSASDSVLVQFEPKGICKIYQAGACKLGELFWIGISADPESVNSGSSTLITWEADGADTCSLYKDGNPFNTSVNSNTGSVSSGNLTKETTFKVICQKEEEKLDASVVVGINEEVTEEPGEQEQNKFGVTLSCDAKQGTSTDYYINRNTTWKVEVNNPKGAKLDRRSWSGTNVSSNSNGNTLDKIYTTVGNKTMNIFDVYSLDGATSSAKCTKTIKLKLDSGTNTEI